MALSFSLFGETAWAARLPGALLSASSVPMLFLLARRVMPDRDQALWWAVVFLTLIPVLRHGRLAMLDGMMVAWFLALLLCLLRAEGGRALWGLGAGLCLSLKARCFSPLTRTGARR